MIYEIELKGNGRSRKGYHTSGHYLTQFKKNDEVWIYLTKTNKIAKVPRGTKVKAKVISNTRRRVFNTGSRVRSKASDYIHLMIFEVQSGN